MMLGDIDGYKVAKVNSSSCYTHSVRISYPINDGLLGAKKTKKCDGGAGGSSLVIERSDDRHG